MVWKNLARPFQLVILTLIVQSSEAQNATAASSSTNATDLNDEGYYSSEEEFPSYSKRLFGGYVNKDLLPEEAYRPKIESIYITSKIRFRYARTRIISVIFNPHASKSQTANFTIRIPKEAFISSFEMRIDERLERYKANITRREDARKMYQFAIKEGKSVTLGLIEHSGLDFDEMVMRFVVGARKKILFNLIYEERLPRIADNYESLIHLVPEKKISKKTNFRIEIIIDETLPIENITVPTDGIYAIKPVNITRHSPKKVVIEWININGDQGKLPLSGEEFAVQYALKSEESTGHVLLINGYFVHFFTPTGLEPLTKHVIFVIDISDSMTGKKMQQMVDAMMEILVELKYGDFFNIVTFSSDVTIWSCYPESTSHHISRVGILPYPADAECKDEARNYMASLEPYGSTNMLAAIETGLEIAKNVSSVHSPPLTPYYQRYHLKMNRLRKPKPERLPPDVKTLMIFFTDGEATSGVVNKDVILSRIKALNVPLQVPIFSLAFGDSADFHFLSKISSRNWAFARKIYENADPSFQLVDFYRGIASIALDKLTFRYETDIGGLSPRNITHSGYSLFFRGSEVIAVGRLQNNDESLKKSSRIAINNLNNSRRNSSLHFNRPGFKATVSAVGKNGSVVIKVPIKDCTGPKGACDDDEEGVDNNKSMERLFVYLTMKRLLEDEFLLSNGEKFNDEEFNRMRDEDVQEIHERAVNMALENGFVTKHTSLVMRTRSIIEEENDGDPNVDPDSEWELFLGNDIPSPQYGKLEISNKEITPERFSPKPTGELKMFSSNPQTDPRFHRELHSINLKISRNDTILEIARNRTAISNSNSTKMGNVTESVIV